MKNGVLERVFAKVGVDRIAPIERQSSRRDLRQRPCGLLIADEQCLVPERLPDHARSLQRDSFGCVDAVEARLQHAGQRDRDLRGEQTRCVDLPYVTGFDGASVDQHLDQLFQVERVASRHAGDRLAQVGAQCGELSKQLVDKLTSAGRVERHARDPVMKVAGPTVRPPLGKRRSRGRHDQDRRVVAPLGQIREEVEALVVGPVQVLQLEDDDPAVAGRDAPEQLRRGVKRATADLLRIIGVPLMCRLSCQSIPIR